MEKYYIKNRSLEDLFRFCSEMNTKMKEKKEEIILNHFVNEIIFTLDLVSTKQISNVIPKKINGHKNLLYFAHDKIEKLSKSGRPEYDFGSSAIFFQPTIKKILCLSNIEHPDLSEIWYDHSEVKDYDYPEYTINIDIYDHSKRRKKWEDMVKINSNSPDQLGFSFVFTDKVLSTFWWEYKYIDKIIKKIPSFEDRLEMIAIDKINLKSIDGENKDHSLYNIIRTSENHEWTKEFEDEVGQIKNEFRPLMVPNDKITLELLRSDFFEC